MNYRYFFAEFWTGKTGRALKAQPRYITIMATYLFTCGNSRRIGLYYLPKVFMAHELGLTEDEVGHGLEVLEELEFCLYDHDREMVLVHEMAAYQLGQTVKIKDNKRIYIQKELQAFPESELKERWRSRYTSAFSLDRHESQRVAVGGGDPPSEGASRPCFGGGATQTAAFEGALAREEEEEEEEEERKAKARNVVRPPPTPTPDGEDAYKLEEAKPGPPGFEAGDRAAEQKENCRRPSGVETGNPSRTLAAELHSLVGGMAMPGSEPGPQRGYSRANLRELCTHLGLEYLPIRNLSTNARRLLDALELYAPWPPAACLRAMESVLEAKKPKRLNSLLYALGEQLLHDALPTPGDQRDDGSAPCATPTNETDPEPEPGPETKPPTKPTRLAASEKTPPPEQLN